MLKASRSGYYDWATRPESARETENRQLVKMIREIHEESRFSYGSPRVTAELRLGLGLAADDPEGADEGYPVWIQISLVCGFPHQVPDSVVGEQQAPDFLLYQFGLPGSEDHPRSALMRLQLVEDKLSFPALMIGGGHLDSTNITGIGDIGNQRYQLVTVPAVRDLVIDGAHVSSRQVRDLRQPLPEPVRVQPLGVGISDERQVRAVRKPSQDRQANIRSHPEKSIAPGIDDRPEF